MIILYQLLNLSRALADNEAIISDAVSVCLLATGGVRHTERKGVAYEAGGGKDHTVAEPQVLLL